MELVFAFAVVVVTGTVVVFCIALILDFLFGEEDFATSSDAMSNIGEIINASDRRNGTLFDLGSCRGSFCFGIAARCYELHVTGIDKSFWRTLFARLQKLFRGNTSKIVSFLQADIFTADISRIDFAFVYLPRPLLGDLEKKLRNELKPGAWAITYRVNFPTWEPTAVLPTDYRDGISHNSIFLYQVGNS